MDTPGAATVHESACRRYEAAWRAGTPRPLEQFLPPESDPTFLATLEELVHIELELTWKQFAQGASAKPRPVEEYLARHPRLAEPAVALRLVRQEYRLRQRHGDEPTPHEYQARFPGAVTSAEDVEPLTTLPGKQPWPPLPALPALARPLPTVPGYDILRELGHGGMGVVYEARQLQLNRTVALKMILGGTLASAEDLARFKIEAEAVAQLQHPNIVQIFESGETGGLPYFTLEYVAGGTLAARVRNSTLPPNESARLVDQLARGVAYAHAQGIVHRDLKPENVLLATEDIENTERKAERQSTAEGSGRGRKVPAGNPSTVPHSVSSVASVLPKIADFGLAKLLDPEGRATLGREPSYSAGPWTRSGAVVGTPAYMAPEQARGEVRKVGPLADVYALGAILYRLLAGKPPFQATTAAETLVLVLEREPVPPRQVQPAVPRDLETIALKCLQKDPARRYASAQELAEDLARYLRGEPILARPVGRLERAAKWVRRNKGLSAGLAAAVLALMAGTAVAWSEAVAAEAAADSEREQRLIAQGEKAAADHARRVAVGEKQAAEDARKAADVARHSAEDKQKLLDAALQRATKELRRFELMHYLDHIAAADKALRGHDLVGAAWHLDECKPALRHVEHSYLRLRLAGRSVTLPGYPTAPQALALSGDGKRLYAGGTDHVIRIWDLGAAREVGALRGHGSAIACLVPAADGKRLYSAAFDMTVKVWDLDTGKEIQTLRGHTNAVTGLALSADGKRLVSCSYDKTLKVWDSETGKEMATLQGHTSVVWTVALSADGKKAYSGSEDETIKVWDLDAGKEEQTFKGHTSRIDSLAVTPDGKRLYAGTFDPAIKVWNLETGKPAGVLRGHAARVTGLALSADGARLVSCSEDKTVKVWDTQTGQELHTLRGHGGPVWRVALAPGGSRLLSASFDRTIRVWDLGPGNDPSTPLPHRSRVYHLVLSADARRAYSGGDFVVNRLDLEPGKTPLALGGHTSATAAVALAPGGKRLYSASFDAAVKYWDLDTGKETLVTRSKSAVFALALSPDGKRLAFGGWDTTVTVWDLDAGKEQATLKGHTDLIHSLAWSPDGQWLYSGSHDATIKQWDAASGKEVRTLRGHGGPVRGLAATSDGTRLCSASDDKTLKVWDLPSGAEMLTLRGHGDKVTCLAVTADGRRLASGSSDKTVKLWDLEAGKEALTLRGHTEEVLTLALTADGRRLVSGGADSLVRVWDLAAE